MVCGKLKFCRCLCQPKAVVHLISQRCSLHIFHTQVFFTHSWLYFYIWKQETIPASQSLLSCTCCTAIYILVFLTSPMFFFFNLPPLLLLSHLTHSSIFPLLSNCRTKRQVAFYASSHKPKIIVYIDLE